LLLIVSISFPLNELFLLVDVWRCNQLLPLSGIVGINTYPGASSVVIDDSSIVTQFILPFTTGFSLVTNQAPHSCCSCKRPKFLSKLTGDFRVLSLSEPNNSVYFLINPLI